jgi:phenylacetate-CoA ligase
MLKEQKYWNPVLETLPQEKLQDLQLKKFKRLFQWGYERSKFHRSLYDKAGIEPDDIRSFEDIRHVPKVEKSMMRGIQGKDPFPYGDALCVAPEEVTEFHQTSGTTGQPIYQADTWQDWESYVECWCFILWAQGYRPNVLDTKARILKIQELKATAMMGTPTYMLGMAATARNKMGIDPSLLTINKITCAGEPGASIPSTKQRLEEAWGAKVYDHAGATEIGAWSYECQAQPGGMHVIEGLFLVEIEDVVTGEIISEPERQGKMIITALDRLAQPCIRFDSKDIIEWSKEPCPCGRSFRLIKGGVIGRADDITKVKGVLLAPSAIEEVVRGIEGLGDEYEVLVDKKGDVDQITLKVELSTGSEGQRQMIENQLIDQLRLKTNLRYDLEFHEYGTLPRYEVKARRFKDLRKTH